MGSVSPFSPTYSSRPSSPRFSGNRVGYGIHPLGAGYAYAAPQEQSGGGIFSTLWKGAAAIGVGILSLKFFKPEWLKSAAESIGSTISKYTPDSVLNFFKPFTDAVKAQFSEGGTLNGLINTATNAVRSVFNTVAGLFGKAPTTTTAESKATATAAETTSQAVATHPQPSFNEWHAE